jgi:hypothetical protein
MRLLMLKIFFQSHFTNAVTLNLDFNLEPFSGQYADDSAMNLYNPIENVSFSTLVHALQTHETSPDEIAAVNSLGYITDPTGGQGFAIPVGMARILGLAGAGTGIDDTITLNSNLPWIFGADATGALEHEISEGAMGRIGGLGIQNGVWGPMDLFRYSAGDNRDYTGTDQTYFSLTVKLSSSRTPYLIRMALITGRILPIGPTL